METITYKMAKLTDGVRFEQFGKKTIETAKRFLLDSIGCAYGGSQTHDVKIMLDFYNEAGGAQQATVFNSTQKLPLLSQSLLNSLMIRALDYNDIYWEEDPSHPSDLIPAALTPAEYLHNRARIF